MPLRCSPKLRRFMVACISPASGNSDGRSRSRTAQASAFKTRCQISGTGPAPSHTDRRLGHKAGSTSRSGTSTKEKRIGCKGRQPGGAMVKRAVSISA